MRNFVYILFVFLPFLSTAQEVDNRLLQNHGDTIYRIQKQKHNYYQYLRYELDYSYVIKAKNELSSVQRQEALEANQFTNVNGEKLHISKVQQSSFNFKEWGISLHPEKEIYIKLNTKQYLVFLPRTKVGENFQLSPYYTK
jgi:chlorite dismutase